VNDKISDIVKKAERALEQHHVGGYREPLTGAFSLHRGATDFDLYGMVDAVYILHTVGRLAERTDRSSRTVWAERILACQDGVGWFSRLNLRGHSREHATAYAIGALALLEIEPDEQYVIELGPLHALESILIDRNAFLHWISCLDFRPSLRAVLEKRLGWHYIWRGSHVGGGIPAALGMAWHSVEEWWPGQVDLDEWFLWYFEWLDAHTAPESGYWQRAFWNLAYHVPTLIDMGGATHFFWVYEAKNRPFPHPAPVIESTLRLQQPSGLYKDHPFCIDLDGNFCLIRSYLQLPEQGQQMYRDRVYRSVRKSFEAIVEVLVGEPWEELYSDSHGLPGALAALVECTKLPGLEHAEALSGWQHPLDKAWWL
jgi:hypothetical protein